MSIACVIGLRQRGGPLRFVHAENATSETLYETIKAHVDPAVDLIMTEEHAGYNALSMSMYRGKHQTIKHAEKYVEGIVHTNTVESAFCLLKRGVIGTYHRLSMKHLCRYLQEFSYRFDNRKNKNLYAQTVRSLLATSNLPYQVLVS